MNNRDFTFEEFYNKTSRPLLKYILTIARFDKDCADDIFQNTMISAYKSFHKLRYEEGMLPWAYAISKNEARRYFHKNKKLFDIELQAYDDSEEEMDRIEQELDFSEAVIGEDNLIKMLNQVDLVTQQILILVYCYDMQLKDISKTIDMNYNTVRSIHRRGLEKLRKKINEEDYND